VSDKPSSGPSRPANTQYKKGDLIGQRYKVYGVLGKVGFGIVYLVFKLDTKNVYALKTFRDELMADSYRHYLELSADLKAPQVELARRRLLDLER
jgi:serine/threonine protein kinase